MTLLNIAAVTSILLALGQDGPGGEPRAPEPPRDGAPREPRSSCAMASPAPPVPQSNDACLGCHGPGGRAGTFSHQHPVDGDYASAQRRIASLRPMAAVVARGVRLPDGRLQCVTCHDARSPWAKWITLPAGAVPRRAGASRDPDGPSWRAPPAGPRADPPPGTAVSTAPLCAACHTFAD